MRWTAIGVLAIGLLVAWTWSDGRRSQGANRHQPLPITSAGKQNAPARPLALADENQLALDAPVGTEATEACGRDHALAVQQRARVLATSSDARMRLASYLLSQASPEGVANLGAARPLAAALVAAPEDDALARWIAVGNCRAPGCDESAAIALMLKADPDNVMAWTTAIAAEVRRGDLVQADRLLQRAAAAQRVDTYWGETARLAVDAIGPLAQTPACERASVALARDLQLDRPATMDDLSLMTGVAVSSMQLPALLGLSELCPQRQQIARHRRAACRAVALRLTQSELFLLQLMGVGAMEAHAQTAAERTYWRERRRNLAWLGTSAGKVMKPEHLPLMWEQGEVPVMIALLEEAGRWPAPASWKPDDIVSRALAEGE